MMFLYFIIGILTGVLLSILNMFAYKKEVQTKLRRMMGKKAVVVDMGDPFEGIEFTNEQK